MTSKEEAIAKHRRELEEAAARRKTTRTQAQSDARSEIAATRKYIEEEVGVIPWIEHIYKCMVLEIPEQNVAIVDAGFPGGPIPALFGETKPKINEFYELRWPSKGALPWIKVPTTKRWLYQKVRWSSSTLMRWPWPPPPVGQGDWHVEILQNSISRFAYLAGGSKLSVTKDVAIALIEEKAGGPTELIYQAGSERAGTPGGIESPYRTLIHYYEQMGTLGGGTWTSNPEFVHAKKTANFGPQVVGDNKSWYVYITRFNGVIPQLVLDPHFECCKEGIDGKTYCIGLDNWKEDYSDIRVFENRPETFRYGNNGYLGNMAENSLVDFAKQLDLTEGATDIHEIFKSRPVGFPVRAGSGCHWANFNILYWDKYWEYIQYVMYPDLFYSSAKPAGPLYDVVPIGVWNYDGLVTTAFVYNQGFNENGYRQDPNMQTFLISHGNAGLMANITQANVGAISASLDTDEGSTVVLWGAGGTRQTPRGMKWDGYWRAIPDVSYVFCASQDGNDVFGASEKFENGPLTFKFSSDGGNTWDECAPPQGAYAQQSYSSWWSPNSMIIDEG